MENITMMWEVMSEEEVIQKQINKEVIVNIFISNCAVFYNQEIQLHPHIGLMDLNKRCMLAFLDFMKTFGSQHQQQKIMIHKEDVSVNKEVITIEELKSKRQLEFNTKLNEMQSSFDDLNHIPRPPTPVFQDKEETVSLSSSEMEMNLQQVIAQRKYDIAEVKKTVQFANVDIQREKEKEEDKETIYTKIADIEKKLQLLQQSIDNCQQTMDELQSYIQKIK